MSLVLHMPPGHCRLGEYKYTIHACMSLSLELLQIGAQEHYELLVCLMVYMYSVGFSHSMYYEDTILCKLTHQLKLLNKLGTKLLGQNTCTCTCMYANAFLYTHVYRMAGNIGRELSLAVGEATVKFKSVKCDLHE